VSAAGWGSQTEHVLLLLCQVAAGRLEQAGASLQRTAPCGHAARRRLRASVRPLGLRLYAAAIRGMSSISR
jgi:hypothetical protein